MSRPTVARALASFVVTPLLLASIGVPVGVRAFELLTGVTAVSAVLGLFAAGATRLAPRFATAVSALLVVAALHRVVASHLESALAEPAFAPLAVGWAAGAAVAIAALAGGTIGASFAGGVVVALAQGPEWCRLVGLGVVLASLLHAASEEARWRHTVTTTAAGLAVGVTLVGLGVDLTFALSDPPVRYDWVPDPVASRAVRMVLEIALLAACAPLCCGRTWGLVAFVTSALALAWTIERFPLPFWCPRVGDFCVASGLWAAPFLGATTLASAPWVVPIVRALRAPRCERQGQ